MKGFFIGAIVVNLLILLSMLIAAARSREPLLIPSQPVMYLAANGGVYGGEQC